MTEPLRLVTNTEPPCEVDAETIQMLENLLARARAGEFNGLAVVTLTSPSVGAYTGCGSAWTKIMRVNVHTALGGIDVLRHRLMTSGIEFGD